jgi:hypothetical protein
VHLVGPTIEVEIATGTDRHVIRRPPVKRRSFLAFLRADLFVIFWLGFGWRLARAWQPPRYGRATPAQGCSRNLLRKSATAAPSRPSLFTARCAAVSSRRLSSCGSPTSSRSVGEARASQPVHISRQSLYRLAFRSTSNSAIDCPSTPAAPLLVLTFDQASQTARLETANDFGGACQVV